MTKRGPGKSSTLKQLQANATTTGTHVLSAQFQEDFDFKASLFYETDGTCIPKVLRLNINRVCRIEDSSEYSVVLLGYVNIQLHDVPNTGADVFQTPLTTIDSKSISGSLTVKLIMFENKSDFDLDDNASVSSIGSNLSFMQRENVSSINNKKSSSSVAVQNRSAARRKTGGQMPEAGLPGMFTRTSRPELETLLTEMSIVKMHLDKALADKSNMEATHKDDMREVAHLRMERVAQADALKIKDEQLVELQRNNDMLCKAMTKLQETLVAKEKELNYHKQERKAYLKNDRILHLKDKALLAELTKASEHIPAATSSEEYLTLPLPAANSLLVQDTTALTSFDEDNKTKLFEPDEVDYEATATLKKHPSKAALFNDDVVELLKSHVAPPPAPDMYQRRSSGSASGSEGPMMTYLSGSMIEKRASLFTEDEEDESEDTSDISTNKSIDQENVKGRDLKGDAVRGHQETPKGKGKGKGSGVSKVAVHVRSTSPSGFVTYTPATSSKASATSSVSTSSLLLQQL